MAQGLYQEEQERRAQQAAAEAAAEAAALEAERQQSCSGASALSGDSGTSSSASSSGSGSSQASSRASSRAGSRAHLRDEAGPRSVSASQPEALVLPSLRAAAGPPPAAPPPARAVEQQQQQQAPPEAADPVSSRFPWRLAGPPSSRSWPAEAEAAAAAEHLAAGTSAAAAQQPTAHLAAALQAHLARSTGTAALPPGRPQAAGSRPLVPRLKLPPQQQQQQVLGSLKGSSGGAMSATARGGGALESSRSVQGDAAASSQPQRGLPSVASHNASSRPGTQRQQHSAPAAPATQQGRQLPAGQEPGSARGWAAVLGPDYIAQQVMSGAPFSELHDAMLQVPAAQHAAEAACEEVMAQHVTPRAQRKHEMMLRHMQHHETIGPQQFALVHMQQHMQQQQRKW